MLTPPDQGISAYLQSSVALAGLKPNAKVLDAPTGFGRHAHWLSRAGYRVVAIDWDAARIDQAREAAPAVDNEIVWKVGNLEEDDSRVFNGTFDLMVCVHYFSESIISRAYAALKPGGVLILETFGGQGGNWRSLPRPGWAATAAAEKFDIMSLRETLVGPSKEHVTVKLVARKGSVS